MECQPIRILPAHPPERLRAVGNRLTATTHYPLKNRLCMYCMYSTVHRSTESFQNQLATATRLLPPSPSAEPSLRALVPLAGTDVPPSPVAISCVSDFSPRGTPTPVRPASRPPPNPRSSPPQPPLLTPAAAYLIFWLSPPLTAATPPPPPRRHCACPVPAHFLASPWAGSGRGAEG